MKHRRFSRILMLSLTIAAVSAPAAMAAPSDLRYLMHTSSLAGTPGIDHRTPDAIDAAAGRGTSTAPKVTVVKVQPTPSSAGLDWGDAGIGAGAVLVLMLLALGSGLAIVHRRQGARGPRTVA